MKNYEILAKAATPEIAQLVAFKQIFKGRVSFLMREYKGLLISECETNQCGLSKNTISRISMNGFHIDRNKGRSLSFDEMEEDTKKAKEVKFNKADLKMIEQMHPAIFQAIFGQSGQETPPTKATKHKHKSNMLEKYVNKGLVEVTLVDGRDVTDLSDADIISKIKARKKVLKDLQETGVTGAYFEAKSAEHQAVIDGLLAVLNGRVPAQEAAPAEATEA